MTSPLLMDLCLEAFDYAMCLPESCQWAIFLRNHNELTLAMITDAERDFMWRFYAMHRRLRSSLRR